MITRLAGNIPTRSRGVVSDNLVFTVAVAPDKVPRSTSRPGKRSPLSTRASPKRALTRAGS